MKKQEIQKIEDKVDVLTGQRMVEMERWDDYAEFGFVPAETDEKIIQEQLKTIERIQSDYTIAAFCTFRWTYKDRVVLAEQDIFQPSLPILEKNKLGIREGAEVKDFNFNKHGNNRFDEINEQNFRPIFEQTRSFIVKKINISKFGDLTMEFENGYRLEIFINVSDPHNCWEFYQLGTVNNIMVGANEIIQEDIDVTQT